MTNSPTSSSIHHPSSGQCKGIVGMSSSREYPRNELLAKVRPRKEWTTWELQNLTILHTHAGREGGRGRRLREEFRFIRMTVRARRGSAYSLIHPSARSVRVRPFAISLARPVAGSRMAKDGDNFCASKNKLIAAGVERTRWLGPC